MARTLTYGALIFLSALFIAPFVWTLLTAVKTEAELVAWPPVFWPESWRWSNFAESWAKQPFGTYLWNSTTVVVLILVAVVGFAAMLVPAWRATRIDPVAILRRG